MKDIIGGLLAGIIAGGIQMYFFNGTTAIVIASALLGTFIGLWHKNLNHGFMNIVVFGIICSIIGALFFIAIAAMSGLWGSSLATGAITGGIISVIMKLGFKPKYD